MSRAGHHERIPIRIPPEVPDRYEGPQSGNIPQELLHLKVFLIAKALREQRFNVERAARALGIKRTTLVEWLKRMGWRASTEATPPSKL